MLHSISISIVYINNNTKSSKCDIKVRMRSFGTGFCVSFHVEYVVIFPDLERSRN